ncbi:MAG: HD domain-containing protein [Candidatus Yonathbacteria bacterium]|nr:HD domain-containing protein [Candidatus Yonathbacteria bacterium]
MDKKSNLEGLLSIAALTHSFQQIRRRIYATGEDRFENDAEHSFQLAFIAWYLIEKEGLALNKDKALQYALCHDIVEVFAGDVFFHRTAEEEQKKIDLERAALEQLEETYPDFPSLTETLRSYEEKSDPESKFIYALDKLLPMLNIMLDEGRSWHTNEISLEKLFEGKHSKIAHDPLVLEYFVLIVSILKDKPDMFPKK